MSRLKGVLERSLLTADTVKTEAKRRRELERLPNPVKRLAALALHELALQYPEQIARLIGMEPTEQQPTVVGSGADTVVYRVDQNVMKVHKASIGATPKKQRHLAARKQYRESVLRSGLPDFTLPAQTSVTKHPAYAGIDVVCTTQAYQPDIQDTYLFLYRSAGVDPKQLEQLAQRGFVNQLQEFARASRQLRDSTGYMPDLLGQANIVTANDVGRLLLIDSQPLDIHRANGAILSARIDNLSNALRDYS